MPQMLWRIIIVVLVGFFLMLLVPLILSFLGLDVGGAGMQIIRICLAAIAVFYIIWGPPVVTPKIT